MSIFKAHLRAGPRSVDAIFLLFFSVAAALSAYQNVFGLFSWDVNFLNSGVGSIGAEGYLSHADIRPMSFFSGLSEATFFYLVATVIFAQNRNYALCGVALLLTFISGSRGVILSFCLALFLNSFVVGKDNAWWKVVTKSMIFGGIFYACIMALGPLLSFIQGAGGKQVFLLGLHGWEIALYV